MQTTYFFSLISSVHSSLFRERTGISVWRALVCVFARLRLFAQGVSWGSYFSILAIFIFWDSYTLHIRDFHARYYRTPPFIGSVQCLCASWLCIPCFFSPHTFEGLYIWRVIYIWRTIYIWRAISIWRPISVWRALRSSEDWIILTLRYQLRQKWRNWSLEIRTMYQAQYTLYVYTPCLYTWFT